MFPHRAPWLLFAFVAGMCLAGLPNWLAPYNRGGLIDPLMVSGLAGLSAMTMMLVVGGIAPPSRAWLAMTPCLPLAVAARIVVERAHDPAVHDHLQYWPLQIVAAIALGAAAALLGAFAGLLAQRLQDPRRGN